MKKLIVFILITNLSASIMFSCQDDGKDDHQNPFIDRETISFKDGDTLWISSDYLNKFSIDASDNESLSGLKIQLNCPYPEPYDTAVIIYKKDTLGNNTEEIDSVPLFKKVYRWSLYYQKLANVTDSFSIQTVTTYRSKSYPVREGNIYELVVGCVDRAGNYDSIVFKNITLLVPPGLDDEDSDNDSGEEDDDDEEVNEDEEYEDPL